MANFALTGLVDGVNKTFTVASGAFASGTAWLVHNGRTYPPTEATYGLTESSSTVVVLNTAPSTNGYASGQNGTVPGADFVSLQADGTTSGSGAWTYNTALTSNKDLVRFYSGDVDSTDQEVPDATITTLLTLYPDPRKTAAMICRSRAAYWSRFADTVNGALAISAAKDRAQAFADRAAELEQQLAQGSATMLVGGLSYASKQATTDNTDNIPPVFRRGQFNTRGQRPTRPVTEQN